MFIATDVASYGGVAHALVRDHPCFVEIVLDREHPGFTTSFARKYRAAGRGLYGFTFERRTAADSQVVAASKMRSM